MNVRFASGDQTGPRPGVGHRAAGDHLLAEPGARAAAHPREAGEHRHHAHPRHPEARQAVPRHRQLRHRHKYVEFIRAEINIGFGDGKLWNYCCSIA